MPATYTVKQVSKLLGYSTNSIYTYLKEKRLKGVRIGKGRFRIPQSELDKFLQFEKGILSKTSPINPIAPTAVGYADTCEDFTASEQVEVPSLFDWFIGVSAIILGSSWMLFANSYSEFPSQMYILIIPMLRGVLVASGIGLLLSDMKGSTARVWGQVFQGVLLAFGHFFCVILVRIYTNGLLLALFLYCFWAIFFRKQQFCCFLSTFLAVHSQSYISRCHL
jgi:excisionase family DNA binding protein